MVAEGASNLLWLWKESNIELKWLQGRKKDELT